LNHFFPYKFQTIGEIIFTKFKNWFESIWSLFANFTKEKQKRKEKRKRKKRRKGRGKRFGPEPEPAHSPTMQIPESVPLSSLPSLTSRPHLSGQVTIFLPPP
jgi:hypothetical protein